MQIEPEEVDWRDIAKRRWPLCKIEGNGPFVAMLRRGAIVYLFRTVFERSTGAPPNSEFVTLHQRKREHPN